MEQFVISELTENLSSLLTERLFEEVWLITRFKEDFEFICDEVNSIKCLLSDASRKMTSSSSSLTNWLNKLEDFITDVVDIVEECSDRKFHFLNIISPYIISPYRMGRKIRVLKQRIIKIQNGAKYLKYLTSVNVNAGVQALLNVEEDSRRNSNAVQPGQFHEVVGMDRDIELITEWILEETSRVIAVVGMGGMGKTLLVQRVLDMPRTDGLQAVWHTIGLQVPASDNKIKIVVTTRDSNVAAAMQANHIHNMNVLSEIDSWKLFCNHSMFEERLEGNSQLPGNQHLTNIARRIVRKCSGLPLAVKTIAASVVSARMLPNEWESILYRLHEVDSISNRVMHSLRLSYHALPHPLKPCFLYCSAFPANSQIKSEHLVHLWIAEAFISTSTREAREEIYEVARSYIDLLIGRCLMESSGVGRDGRVKFCKMHDLLHKLGSFESHKQTKCLLKPGNELKELPVNECEGVRRISMIKNSISTVEQASRCSTLRTLLLRDNTKIQSISDRFFDNLRYLGVLDLSQTSINSLPVSIGNLKHLKFLNLSKTKIKELPNSMSGLKPLQFLDVSGCQQLSTLHPGIGGHKSMVYLNMKGCNLESLPAGISELSNLRTLKGARILFKRQSKAALLWTGLKGLTRLQHLSVTAKSSSDIGLDGTFGGMTEMRILSFRNISSSSNLLQLPNDMESMERLEIVRLRNCAVPKWISRLENLIVLVLEGSIPSTDYGDLPKIPNLKELRLSHNNDCVQFPAVFEKIGAFSKLERFNIEHFNRLENFPSLHDRAMQRLKYLGMKECNLLKLMPEPLQKLTSLEEIVVECCSKWEVGFWGAEGTDRDSTLKILDERKIKLTINSSKISIERNIENDNNLRSVIENFAVSMRRDRSMRDWISLLP